MEMLVGVDNLNAQLGGVPGQKGASEPLEVGLNVLVGGAPGDDWRKLAVLRDWSCDGVVLSNEVPHCYLGGGEHDSQLFNICVKGPAQVNNGIADFSAGIVESYSSRSTLLFGSKPVYNTNCQVFDSDVRHLASLYVGLVATIHPVHDWEWHRPARGDTHAAGEVGVEPNSKALYYHTFQYVLFSSNQACRAARGEESRPEQTKQPSKEAWAGMVGAWRVGRVMDTASQNKSSKSAGISSTGRMTVDVSVEFLDWRALRRLFPAVKDTEFSIGGALPGAAPWKIVAAGPIATDTLASR